MPKGDSTIENRVYVFTPLATELVKALGPEATSRRRLRSALAELARAACIVADSEGLDPDEVAARIEGPKKKSG